MNLNLSNKIALITGSSRGIGYSIAQTLHAEGCQVILNGKNSTDLKKASDSLPNSIGICADMTKPHEVRSMVESIFTKFGKLDILICNVGNGNSVAPGEETAEEWNRVFSLNMWSCTNIIEASKSLLISSKGVIVCISSICGLDVVPNAPLTYSAAKAALNAYVRGLANPLGTAGVRINAVAPGNILTEESSWNIKLKENPSGVKSILDKNVPLRRLGKAEEVANLVAYLASPLANFATGSIWTIDGGQIHK